MISLSSHPAVYLNGSTLYFSSFFFLTIILIVTDFRLKNKLFFPSSFIRSMVFFCLTFSFCFRVIVIFLFLVSPEKKEVFVSINPNQICHIKGIELFLDPYSRVHMPMLICVFEQLMIAKAHRRKDQVHPRRTCKLADFLILLY